MKNRDTFRPASSPAKIRIFVEKVRVEGDGVIILTGPSSCGKGEVAKSLRRFLSIPNEKHLSMGEILRTTVARARDDLAFREKLAGDYGISHRISILDPERNARHLAEKAQVYLPEIRRTLKVTENHVSQLDWLEFCVSQGLLVPDAWTESIIDALFANSPHLRHGIMILDGYPRTVAAAESLLDTFENYGIGVIKVLHLSITKQEMKLRALGRNREDDTEDSLERRYQFYVEKVQPCVDYLKTRLGTSTVSLIDAHQPAYDENGVLDLDSSIQMVTVSVIQAIGLPRYLLEVQ